MLIRCGDKHKNIMSATSSGITAIAAAAATATATTITAIINVLLQVSLKLLFPDSKVHGANMRPIWGRQDPDGPHVGPVNFVIWDYYHCNYC